MTGDAMTKNSSKDYAVSYGVLQGSCLGPLLFLVFCNDLPINLINCNSILFADDTTLYKSHRNLRYLVWMVQEELKQLSNWFKSNKFTLNPHKCVSMLFDPYKKKNVINITVDGIPLKQAEYTKFLGVWIDEKMCWCIHLEKNYFKTETKPEFTKSEQKVSKCAC